MDASTDSVKQIFLVRHGEYNDSDLSLSEYGVLQARSLSNEILSRVSDKKVVVLSSTAKRAFETATIIAKKLKVKVIENEVFWSDNTRAPDSLKAFEIIRKHSEVADIIIIITHYEYFETFLPYFAKRQLGQEVKSWVVSKGCMLVLDWSKGRAQLEEFCPSVD